MVYVENVGVSKVGQINILLKRTTYNKPVNGDKRGERVTGHLERDLKRRWRQAIPFERNIGHKLIKIVI